MSLLARPKRKSETNKKELCWRFASRNATGQHRKKLCRSLLTKYTYFSCLDLEQGHTNPSSISDSDSGRTSLPPPQAWNAPNKHFTMERTVSLHCGESPRCRLSADVVVASHKTKLTKAAPTGNARFSIAITLLIGVARNRGEMFSQLSGRNLQRILSRGDLVQTQGLLGLRVRYQVRANTLLCIC